MAKDKYRNRYCLNGVIIVNGKRKTCPKCLGTGKR